LGLAICNQLVQLMGGRMCVESESGRGSTFHFTARFEIQSGVRDMAEHQLPAHALEQRVLVVDDNATNRRILMERLSGWDMQAEAVESGAEALVALRENAAGRTPFTIVLLDVMMPEMDGFEVAQRIVEDPELTPAIIVLSSADSPTSKERNRELGIATSLRKPISQADLFDALLRIEGVDPIQSALVIDSDHAMRALHILLAEDNVFNQRVATGLLEKLGHRITVVDDGRKAVEASAEQDFDAVLMDVQMPQMDGLAATRAIRQREAEAAVERPLPIIGLTAHAMQGDRERCIEAGMNEYVTKPIRPDELRRALGSLTGGSEKLGDRVGALPKINRAAVLERCGGDEDLLRELVAIFRQDCPAYMQSVRAGVESKEGEALSRAAHTLKGPLGTLGFDEAQQFALQLEEVARRGEMDNVEQAFAELEREMCRIEPLLDVLEAGEGAEN
jgi:two-component system, sensor histidine kinase and response regulator